MAQATNAYVVDASVAAKWHLPEATEEHTDRALAVLAQFRADAIGLIAPRHIRFEVPSSLAVAATTTNPRLTPAEAQARIDAFLAIPLITFDEASLLSAAFPLVMQYSIAFYDAVYLALAQREHAPLITADRKCFARTSHLPDVIWIGDWQP